MQIFFSLLASVALSATAADENSGTNLDVLLTVLWRSMLHAPSPAARGARGWLPRLPAALPCARETSRPGPNRRLQRGREARPKPPTPRLPTRRWCVPVGLAISLESPLLKVWQALKARQNKQWETQATAEAHAEAGTQRPAIVQLRAKANAVKRMRPRGAAALAASSSESLGGGGVLVGVGDAVPMSRGAPPPPPQSSLGESSRAQRLRSRVTGARPRAPTWVSTASSSSIDGALVAPTASCVASDPSYIVALSMPVQALSPPPPPPQAGPNLMDIIAPGAVAAPSALARARLANKRKFPKLPTTFRRKSSGPLPPPPMLPQEASNSGSLRIDDLPEPSLAPPPPPPMPPPEDEPRVYI